MILDFSLSFVTRIQLTLPPWYGSTHLELDATVAGRAAGHATVAGQITGLLPFTRLGTTPGAFLDVASFDFLGNNLPRLPGEQDATFAARIKAALFQTTGTRPDFIRQLTAIVGTPPIIFDCRQPMDTGVAGNIANMIVPTLFYNGVHQPQGLTNYKLGYQWFVTTKNIPGETTTDRLYAYINSIKDEGVVIWMNVTD